MGSVSQKILDKGDYFQLENDSWTLQKDEFTDSNTAAWKKGENVVTWKRVVDEELPVAELERQSSWTVEQYGNDA